MHPELQCRHRGLNLRRSMCLRISNCAMPLSLTNKRIKVAPSEGIGNVDGEIECQRVQKAALHRHHDLSLPRELLQ